MKKPNDATRLDYNNIIWAISTINISRKLFAGSGMGGAGASYEKIGFLNMLYSVYFVLCLRCCGVFW